MRPVRGEKLEGRWYVTDRALEQWRVTAGYPNTDAGAEAAMEALLVLIAKAHFVRRLESGLELWRVRREAKGPRQRYQFIVGEPKPGAGIAPGRALLPALVAVRREYGG